MSDPDRDDLLQFTEERIDLALGLTAVVIVRREPEHDSRLLDGPDDGGQP